MTTTVPWLKFACFYIPIVYAFVGVCVRVWMWIFFIMRRQQNRRIEFCSHNKYISCLMSGFLDYAHFVILLWNERMLCIVVCSTQQIIRHSSISSLFLKSTREYMGWIKYIFLTCERRGSFTFYILALLWASWLNKKYCVWYYAIDNLKLALKL